MRVNRQPFETRFDWILATLLWGSLMVGVAVSAARGGSAPPTVSAALIAGAYVIAIQATPFRIREAHLIGEAFAVIGVVASLAAIGLTGGVDSAYLLYSITPTLFAAAFLGPRVGIETALLFIAGLAVVASVLGQEVLGGSLLVAAGVHLVVALSFSQARRMLEAQQAEAVALRQASAETQARMERLEAAHGLLARLSRLTDASELNPVTVGRAALSNLSDVTSFDAGVVALAGDDGAVVVAREGEAPTEHHQESFPLLVGRRRVGFVELSRDGELGPRERDLVEEAVKPVALAFDNILMLRDIARKAVREERTRLARDLHDEIGPSLASLGLALDLALLQYPSEPELTEHLAGLRGSVSTLVEEIRNTVSDLRQDHQYSLLEQAHRSAAELGEDGPELLVELDERRPPRPTIAGDLSAILAEAIRNAAEHSAANSIWVKGYVDYDRGSVSVRDDGAGFVPGQVDGERFGLVGMQERADRIGGELRVESTPGAGTTVTIDWGSP